MKKQVVLILGGTGAMGASLVQILAEEGHEVWVTSRRKRASKYENVHFMQGNAREKNFLEQILNRTYDVIVDFMVYRGSEFKEYMPMLLKATHHYMFLSTSRVYANSKTSIVENTPRLLDVSEDQTFLATGDYPLAKARQEDILISSEYNNWTIIRPYITYNSERLQLGVFEKEVWLYRALKGRTIVFSETIARCMTTLTYGYDVANAISEIMRREDTKREIFHVTTSESVMWNDILQLYIDVIEEQSGKRPKVKIVDDAAILADMGYLYPIKYDREWNRVFDNTKVVSYCDGLKFEKTKVGLKKCLIEFLNSDMEFRDIDVLCNTFAYMDRISGERTDLNEFKSFSSKVHYIMWRYFSSIMLLLKKLKRIFKK